MTSATRYLYRIDANRFGVRVEVGTYDPERWKKSVERGEMPAKLMGGMTFSETASVSTRDSWPKTGDHLAWETDVSQGSTNRSLDSAARACDVHLQAAEIGRFIETQLTLGRSFVQVGDLLTAILPSKAEKPTEQRFSYEVAMGLAEDARLDYDSARADAGLI